MDIILGVVWLETLGKVVMEWREMSMIFNNDGRIVKLNGSGGLRKKGNDLHKSVTLHSIVGKEMRQVDILCWPIEKETDQEQQGNLELWQQIELRDLLQMYGDVFKEHEGIPLMRSTTHSITLQQGAGSMSVRPYRYPRY